MAKKYLLGDHSARWLKEQMLSLGGAYSPGRSDKRITELEDARPWTVKVAPSIATQAVPLPLIIWLPFKRSLYIDGAPADVSEFAFLVSGSKVDIDTRFASFGAQGEYPVGWWKLANYSATTADQSLWVEITDSFAVYFKYVNNATGAETYAYSSPSSSSGFDASRMLVRKICDITYDATTGVRKITQCLREPLEFILPKYFDLVCKELDPPAPDSSDDDDDSDEDEEESIDPNKLYAYHPINRYLYIMGRYREIALDWSSVDESTKVAKTGLLAVKYTIEKETSENESDVSDDDEYVIHESGYVITVSYYLYDSWANFVSAQASAPSGTVIRPLWQFVGGYPTRDMRDMNVASTVRFIGTDGTSQEAGGTIPVKFESAPDSDVTVTTSRDEDGNVVLKFGVYWK